MADEANKLSAQTSFYSDSVDLWVFSGFGRARKVATSLTFEDFEEGMPLQPSFRVPLEAGQELFEQLWAQGFRSKHDKGNAAALDAARQEHISDLRRAAKLDAPRG